MKDRGQVTIFIIIGVVIVVGIIMVFMFMGRVEVESPADLGPQAFVDKCIRDAVDRSVEKMLFNGGEILPSHAIMYDGDEWNYLCYQADYYKGCYNIHPMLEMQIEAEIVHDTETVVQKCFWTMKEEFEDRGFDIEGGAATYSVNLLPGMIKISLKKRMDVSRSGSSQSFENFDSEIVSPIYELVQVAREIVNAEAQYCNFEYNGYMLLYPRYDIRRIDYSHSKIYRVIDRKSKAEFKFAIRSCALAPGV